MQLTDVLKDFVRRGKMLQKDLDRLKAKMRSCPYDGRQFIPQTHNQKYCSYQCRWHSNAEAQAVKRQRNRK